MFSMNNLNPQATLVQSRVILFLHHIALLWSATINNSGSINIALLRSEDFARASIGHGTDFPLIAIRPEAQMRSSSRALANAFA